MGPSIQLLTSFAILWLWLWVLLMMGKISTRRQPRTGSTLASTVNQKIVVGWQNGDRQMEIFYEENNLKV